MLYLGLGLTYIGFFILRPEFASPVIDTHPPGAPPMYPFVFIVIACGAASGFHSLVSSGTTAKQLDTEPDARPIGYGAMVGESLLGLASVLACTAGFVSVGAWNRVSSISSTRSVVIAIAARPAIAKIAWSLWNQAGPSTRCSNSAARSRPSRR